MSEKLSPRSIPVLGLSVYIAGLHCWDEGYGPSPAQHTRVGALVWVPSLEHLLKAVVLVLLVFPRPCRAHSRHKSSPEDAHLP